MLPDALQSTLTRQSLQKLGCRWSRTRQFSCGRYPQRNCARLLIGEFARQLGLEGVAARRKLAQIANFVPTERNAALLEEKRVCVARAAPRECPAFVALWPSAAPLRKVELTHLNPR